MTGAGLRRGFTIVGDLGALILIAWLIPFIILAIITPQGLAFRAIVALIHWL